MAPTAINPFGLFPARGLATERPAWPRGEARDKVWQRSVIECLGGVHQPRFAAVDGDRLIAPDGDTTDLADALRGTPGAYILKPRFGSNGFCVARVVSHPDGLLMVETDCPDTAGYLTEYAADPAQRGRDLVIAAATHRGRFVDRARVGVPEWALNQSILEEGIRPDRTDGSLFEPRLVAQRVTGDRFAIIGAICKRIDTAVGATVVRGFTEEPLDASLHTFLRDRVPEPELPSSLARAQVDLLAVADRVRATFEPLLTAHRVWVHHLGIDFRLGWDAAAGRVEHPLLEVQLGIGRIDGPAVGAVPGYRPRADLCEEFGPEIG